MVAHVDVGGVEPLVGEQLVVQPALSEHGDVVADALAYPADRGLGRAGVAERFNEFIDLPGGGAG